VAATEVFEEKWTTLPVCRSAGMEEDERTGAALEEEAEVTGTCLPLRRWVEEEMEEDMRMSENKVERKTK